MIVNKQIRIFGKLNSIMYGLFELSKQKTLFEPATLWSCLNHRQIDVSLGTKCD